MAAPHRPTSPALAKVPRPKRGPGVSNRATGGLLIGELTQPDQGLWSDTPPCVEYWRQILSKEERENTVRGGIDIRLVHQLLEKPAEDTPLLPCC